MTWKELLKWMARGYWNKNDTRLKLQEFRLSFFHSFWLLQRSMLAFFARKLNKHELIKWIGEMPEWWIWRVLCSILKEHFYLYALSSSLTHSCVCHILQCSGFYWKVWIFVGICWLFAQLLHPLAIEIDTALSQSQSHSVAVLQCMRCCVTTQNKYQ